MEPLSLILPFLWSGLISLYAVPSVIELAWNKGLMDTFQERKVHRKLTPRLGGVAIFAGTFSGALIFTEISTFIQYFLSAVLILFFVGVKDDLQEIKTWKKLIVQFLAAFLIIYEGGFTLTSFKGIFGIQIESQIFFYLVTMIYIVAFTNTINFIDGLDGLAASLSSIASLILAFYIMQFDVSLALILICLAGSLLGFLRYNIRKSTVFMGDSGSLLAGFIIAVLSLKLIEFHQTAYGFAIVYAVLFIPITDFVRVIIKRLISGKSPISPGRDHIHHILVDSGLSQTQSLAFLVSANVVSALTGILLVTILHLNTNLAIFVLLVLSIILSIYCELRLSKAKS